MIIPCIVHGCINTVHTKPSGVTFHGFPKNPETKEKWILAFKSIKCHPERQKNVFICSEHFMFEDFYPLTESGIRKLREDAVPSVFLSYNTEENSSSKNNAEHTKGDTSIVKHGRVKKKRKNILEREILYMPDASEEEGEEEKEADWLSDKVLILEVDKTPLNTDGACKIKQRPANENNVSCPLLDKQEEATSEESSALVQRHIFHDETTGAFGDMTETDHRKKTLEHNEEIMNTLQCESCGKNFLRKGDLNVHIRSVHLRQERFKCKICDKAFFQKYRLKEHMTKHTGETPYQCEFCGRRFRECSAMARHRKIHEDKRYQCEFCSKMFAQKQGLKSHIRFIHLKNVVVKRFDCEHCSKTFRGKIDWIGHLRKHIGEMPFKCELCEKAFSLKTSLMVHVRTHSEETPFKCGICGKMFKFKSTLNVHLLTHSCKRPFKCEHCANKFTQKSGLIKHLRLHTGEKPFQCDNCSRRFSDKSKLIRHLKTHQ